MLRFDLSKRKKLVFDLVIEGTEPEEVTCMFRIDVDGIEYGFLGEVSPGKVRFDIPPLSEVIGTVPKSVAYQARLDVKKESYIMHPSPWEESVAFELVPKAKAKYKGTSVGEGFVATATPSEEETENGEHPETEIIETEVVTTVETPTAVPIEEETPVIETEELIPESVPGETKNDPQKIRRIVKQLTESEL